MSRERRCVKAAAKAARVMSALMKMSKLDIAALRAAYDAQ
jgi:predicted 3-demethylubiquinone-9 3-methyltransferase (glyoxalase superfamily)